MREIKLLEKYYNEQFKQKDDPKFKELSADGKGSIAKSTDFVFYKLNIAFSELVLAWNDYGKALKKVGFKQ